MLSTVAPHFPHFTAAACGGSLETISRARRFPSAPDSARCCPWLRDPRVDVLKTLKNTNPATARMNSIAKMKMRAKGILFNMACGSKSETAIRLRQVRHKESGFYPSGRTKSSLIQRLAKSPIYGSRHSTGFYISCSSGQAKAVRTTCYNRHNGCYRFRIMRKIGIYTFNPAENAFKVLAFRQFLHLKTVKRRK